MHIWLIDIHPLTFPIANEVNFVMFQLVRMVNWVYSGSLIPVINDVALVMKHCS